MDTFKFRLHPARIGLLALLAGLGGCSLSMDDSPDCQFERGWLSPQCSVSFELPNYKYAEGIWHGKDANGADVSALISQRGVIRFVDAIGRVGSGEKPTNTSAALNVILELAPAWGDTFADGSTAADCLLSGSFVEHKSITVRKSCTTRAGLAFDESLTLSFDPLYNQQASTSIIAGTYAMSTGDVLSIGADGTMFSQSSATGCVINGIIVNDVSAANMYDVQYDMDNCTGTDEVRNGSNYSGLAYLDGLGDPAMLFMALTGEIAGVTVAIVEAGAADH